MTEMSKKMLIFIWILSVIVITASSGCIFKENAVSTTLKEVPIPDVTIPEMDRNIPQITIDSLYLIYNGDNLEKKNEHTNNTFAN